MARLSHRQLRLVGTCVFLAATTFVLGKVLHWRGGEWNAHGWQTLIPGDGAPRAVRSRWSVVSTQSRGGWCDALMRDPKPADKECMPRHPTGCPGAAPHFFSQYGQDAWLWAHHFRYLRRPGVFVDLATNHPIHISNTYFFESCLRWSGLCIEPNAQYHPGIMEHRSCELIPLCVANHSSSVEFIEAGGMGGIAATNKNGERVQDAPRRRITCAPLARLLRRRGLTHIDFLSLDIEGGERGALESIDWGAVRIDVIALEDEDPEGRATQFLTAMGYRPATQSASRRADKMLFHPLVEIGEPTE